MGAQQRSEGGPPSLLPAMPRINGAKVAAFMQTSLIALAPLICMFPAGFFMFLIPSSIFNIYQSALLTSEKFRSRVGLTPDSLVGPSFFAAPRAPVGNAHLHPPLLHPYLFTKIR